jgi:hypothetical protein
MNKREMIHALIDKLLDIEESSKKRTFFYYHGHVQSFDFSVAKNEKAFSDKLISSTKYLSEEISDVDERYLKKCLQDLEAISQVEDGPVEEMVTLQISESKAKEMGLIA